MGPGNQPRRVAVVGVPFDGHSSFLAGAAEGPASLRQALHSPARNLCCESGRDLAEDGGWRDAGDLDLSPGGDPLAAIESGVAGLLDAGERVVALGGDHSISLPLVRAQSGRFAGGEPTIVQLDAHPDLYDELDGDRLSHACPFARILEEGLVRRLVQVGVRAATPHQRRQAERFGVEMLGPDELGRLAGLRVEPPVYLSLDLDVLDPAFAPGVSHPEPGGLSVRELLAVLRELPAPEGADLVELNPRRDPLGLTAVVAAKLLREILDRMLPPAVL